MNPQLAPLLAHLGVPARDAHDLPTSGKRFEDGASYRIEIPSTEGPEGLEAVLEEAERLDVPVHRVSQGSGVFMLLDEELDRYAVMAAMSRVEASLFARPNAAWVPSATTLTPAGGALAPAARGQDQVLDCADDILRAAEHGIRSVLIGDIGVLSLFGEMRRAEILPATMQAKVSVMLPAANPLTAKVLVGLGANTLNLPTDLELAQIAAIRQAVDVPLDIYVEAPSDLGGFVRLHQIPEIVRIAAPVYIKFGLRNGPDIYPSGGHLQSTAVALSRERVRRARLGLELLARSGSPATTSSEGAAGLAVPQVEGLPHGGVRVDSLGINLTMEREGER
jgi:Peptidase family U32